MREAVGRRWRLILALALAGLVLGYLWGVADSPRYEASASVLVEPPPGGEVDPAVAVRLATLGASREVADTAASVLGGDVAGADLLSDIEISPSAEGGTLIITASSEQPDFAAAAADGFAEALTEVAAARANVTYRRASERLEEKLAELAPDSPEAEAAAERLADVEAARARDPLTLGAAAEIPADPAENRPAAATALAGLLVGTILGLAVVLGPLALRRPERPGVEVLPPEPQHLEPEVDVEPESEEELEPEPDVEEVEPEPASAAAALGVADLGLLLDPEEAVRVEGDRRIALRSAGEGPLERLAGALDLGGEDGPRTVAVAGASDRGGSVAVAAVIGALAADRGMRAAVVDADLEAPALAALLELEEDPGLGEYLVGDASPRDVLRTVRASLDDGEERLLICVPAGTAGGDEDGVEGPRFQGLVERLPRVYDLVVFAAPPLTADRGGAMPELVDASILVAGPGPVQAERAGEAVRGLGEIRPVGMVKIDTVSA